jgi:hypothetical protein
MTSAVAGNVTASYTYRPDGLLALFEANLGPHPLSVLDAARKSCAPV